MRERRALDINGILWKLLNGAVTLGMMSLNGMTLSMPQHNDTCHNDNHGDSSHNDHTQLKELQHSVSIVIMLDDIYALWLYG